LLAQVGGPEQVAVLPGQAAAVLLKVSQGMLKPEVIETVVECARRSVGVPLCAAELELLQGLCREALATLERHQRAVSRVRKLGRNTDAALLSPLVGQATAALLVHDVGSPKSFGSARAYLKAYGLNLREKSSGNFKGKLKLTKRGPSRARRYLFLAALRLLRGDPHARAYYSAKVARDGGAKMRAVVALMRKLAKALFAMAHTQQSYDPRKLFDCTRLSLRAP
jgi:transposase